MTLPAQRPLQATVAGPSGHGGCGESEGRGKLLALLSRIDGEITLRAEGRCDKLCTCRPRFSAVDYTAGGNRRSCVCWKGAWQAVNDYGLVVCVGTELQR